MFKTFNYLFQGPIGAQGPKGMKGKPGESSQSLKLALVNIYYIQIWC